jgi:hypothetical protein
LRITVRNDSQRACSVPTGTCLPQVIITTASGSVVWNRATTSTTCMFTAPISLGPGHAARATVAWSPRRCAASTPDECPNTSLLSGGYRVDVHWVAAATITLRLTS